MNEPTFILGIDCGGTHTDAALITVKDNKAILVESAKTETLHDNLPQSIKNILEILEMRLPNEALQKVDRVTMGTTLEINALVQGKAARTALALAAGPGLDLIHFTLGEDSCIVPGGVDHRGVEVEQLYTRELAVQAQRWQRDGVQAVACVSKFSPRNTEHERLMAEVIKQNCSLPVTCGHTLSGKLNFPRRIATAYYNAAVQEIHAAFLDAVEKSLDQAQLTGQRRLLKADGGAIAFTASRREPVQSILSGPAASVMGSLALLPPDQPGCALLLDIGGTTTDLAVLLNGSPVVDRDGMRILGRRTLVRSLASVSIPIGGDSLITLHPDDGTGPGVKVGPNREGRAMAFGGLKPTLVDALNVINPPELCPGDIDASRRGIALLAAEIGLGPKELAIKAVQQGVDEIVRAAYELIETINSKPVYTLAALKASKEARPARGCLVGGPAMAIQNQLARAFGFPMDIPMHSEVANAIGAALTRPTASLEMLADTARGEMWAPAIQWREKISPALTLENVETKCAELLKLMLAHDGMDDATVETLEADLFATLDDRGRGARDMRVTCQATPGIVAHMSD